MEDLLCSSMTHSEAVLHGLDALIENFLYICHCQALVGKVFRIIIVVELTCPTLLVLVEGIIVCKSPIIVIILFIGVPRLISRIRVFMITHV